MAHLLELGKSGETSEVKLTAGNVSEALDNRGKLTSPKVDFPITKNISFYVEVENLSTTMNGNGSIAIDVKCKTKELFEKKEILYKICIYKLSAMSSGETKKRLLNKDGSFYASKLVKPKSGDSYTLHSTDLLKSKVISDNKIDLLVSIEEVYAVEDIRLDWNSRRISTRSILNKVYGDDSFKDIKFMIGGKSLMAHKAICAARSKVFNAMLASDTKERQEGVVEIKDARFVVFKAFIKFLYTNEIGNIKKVIEELMILAEKYDVKDLKEKCENYLSERLNKKNAVDLLIKAEKYNCQALKKNALDVVKFLLKDCKDFNSLYTIPSLVDKVFDLIDKDAKEWPNKRRKFDESSDDYSSDDSSDYTSESSEESSD